MVPTSTSRAPRLGAGRRGCGSRRRSRPARRGETSTSRAGGERRRAPAARAAALLLTTSAASAPVSSREQARRACAWRAAARAGVEVVLEVGVAGARPRRPPRSPRCASGARPRLVWSDDAGRVDHAAGAAVRARGAAAAPTIASLAGVDRRFGGRRRARPAGRRGSRPGRGRRSTRPHLHGGAGHRSTAGRARPDSNRAHDCTLVTIVASDAREEYCRG